MLTKNNNGRTWQLIGLIGIIALIIVMFALFVDLKAVARQLRTADLNLILFACLFFLVGLFTFAIRWRILLNNKPSLLKTFHASNMGHAGNIILPARAGEAIRIVVMGRNDSVSTTEATSSFLVERLFEQIMRLAALIGAVVYGVGIAISVESVVGGLIFILLAFGGIAWLVNHQEQVLAKGPGWLARLPRVSEERARESLVDFLSNLNAVSTPGRLAIVLFWSIVPWLCFWGFFYLTLLALNVGFAPGDRLAISLGAIALSPPSAPTQPGIFHASLVAPIAAVGYQAESLTAYAVVIHMIEMVGMIGLALIGVGHLGISPQMLFARVES